MAALVDPVALGLFLPVLAGLMVLQILLLAWMLLSVPDRAALGRALRHAPRRAAVRFWLRRGLGWIDRWLRPPHAAAAVRRPRRGRATPIRWHMTLRAATPLAARQAAGDAFGWPLADLAMKLAVAYPLLLMASEWAFTGEAVRLGGLALLPDQPTAWTRMAVAALAAVLLLSAFPVADRVGVALQLGMVGLVILITGGLLVGVALVLAAAGTVAAAIAAAVVAAGIIALVFGMAGSVAGAVAGAVAFAAVFALTVAVAGSVAFAFAGSLSVAVAGAVALVGLAVVVAAVALPLTGGAIAGVSGAGAFGVAGGVVLATAAAAAGTGALPHALALGVVLAGVLGVAACLRRGGGGLCHAALFGLVALAVFAAAALTPTEAEVAQGLVLVLGVLPLVCALGDFVAIGKARWLLRRAGRRRWLVIPAGLADLALGLLLVAVCAGLGVAALHGVNLGHQAISGGPLLDLQAVLNDLGSEGALWRHGWLLAALATVLLPSLLNGGVVVFALLAGMAHGTTRRLGALFPRPGAAWAPTPLAVVFASLTGFALLATVLPLAVAVGAVALLLDAMPSLPDRGLWLLGWLARALGAPVDPGLWS